MFPVVDSEKDIRAETLIKILDFFGFNLERKLRRGLDIPREGSSGVGLNGKHPKSITDLHQNSLHKVAGTKSKAKAALAWLRQIASGLLDLRDKLMSRLSHTARLREEAVLNTLKEAYAGSNPPSIDVGAISSFRSWNGGLTHRALLLAIIVETTRLAEYFSKCPSHWSALSKLTDFNGLPGLPFRSGPLHQAVPCLDYTSDDGWNAAAETLEILGPLCGLPAMDHGGLADDILLGRRFLRFVYAEADWFAELPNPETNAVDYRGHHWMALYQRFGMLGHLLR